MRRFALSLSYALLWVSVARGFAYPAQGAAPGQPASPVQGAESAGQPQELPAAPMQALPGATELQASLASIEADSELEPSLKEQLVTAYKAAIERANDLDRARQDLARFQALLAGLPAERERLEADLAAPEPAPEDPSAWALSELEAKSATAQRTLTSIGDELRDQEKRIETAKVRRSELPERIAALDAPTDASPSPTPGSEVPVALSAARGAEQEQRAAARSTQRDAAQAELEWLSASVELEALRKRWIEHRQAIAQATDVRLHSALDTRRIANAEAEARRASEQAARAAEAESALAPLGARIARLAEEKSQITKRSAEVGAQIRRRETELKRLNDQFETTKKRLSIAGLSSLMGVLLREERRLLPDSDQVRVDLSKRQELIARRQLRGIEVEELIHSREGITAEARARLFAAEIQALSEERRAEVEPRAATLLKQEDLYLDELEGQLRSLTADLEQLQVVESNYLVEAERYSTFINERVLWVQSAAPAWRWTFERNNSLEQHDSFDTEAETVLKNRVPDLFDATAAIIAPNRWVELLANLAEDYRDQPGPWWLFAALFVAISLPRRRVRRALTNVANRAGGTLSTSYRPLLRAIWSTLFLALPAGLLLGFLGGRCQSVFDPRPLTLALATVLPSTALLAYIMTATRITFRPQGLAISHLEWPENQAKRLRRDLLIFSPLFLLAYASVGVLDQLDEVRFSGTLGRAIFVGAMLFLALFVARAVQLEGAEDEAEPSAKADSDRAANEPETETPKPAPSRNLLSSLGIVWRWLGIGAPLVLAILSVLGYVFTAAQLQSKLLLTLAYLGGLYLAQEVALRAVEITKRRIAVVRIRRELSARRTPSGTDAQDRASGTPEEDEPERPSLSAVSTQVRQLLATAFGLLGILGVYWIWIDVIPALGILDEVKLWQTVTTAPADPGLIDGVARRVTTNVTLADLGLAIFLGALTMFAMRRIPLLLDILILERLKLRGGERYAARTLIQYLITVIGVFTAFSAIHIGWGQIQFLAAAISVGLGFGLQEIFANFVSGLILLFERPIRIGDMVTISDFHGQVTDIRIRATTIMDYDRREIIIPNKEFVTGKLINWSLSDTVSRLQIDVGVAYGSDTMLARKLLEQVARRTRNVLLDPAPKAIFRNFGESSLDLRLYAHIPDRSVTLEVINDLHTGIDETFKKAKIEISFPQRDLHVRSAPGLEGLFRPPEPAP